MLKYLMLSNLIWSHNISPNKLSANCKIQKENLELLSNLFEQGIVIATWVPSKLNLSYTLTRAVVIPVQVVNSSWYRCEIATNGEEFVDFVEKLKNGNTFLEVKGGETQYYAKDVNQLEDSGYYDKTRKKKKELKKEGRGVG